MAEVKRIVLDVLKPHHPNALEFARALAAQGSNYRVNLQVTEVDEKTESTIITLEADAIDYPRVIDTITGLGGSVHSIDEVEVVSNALHG